MEVGFETVRRIVLGTLRIQGNYDSIPYFQDDIWIFFRVSHVATLMSHDGLEGRACSTRVSVPTLGGPGIFRTSVGAHGMECKWPLVSSECRNEKMETTIVGYIGTTTRIHSFIPGP